MLTTTCNVDDTPAQMGGSDMPAAAHPPLGVIPTCRLPLQSEEARQEYDTIARVLLDAGRFGLEAHMRLSLYASLHDNITTAVAEGKQLRASWFTQMQRALSALKLDELERPPAVPEEVRPNPYAHCGFAARRRAALR